jgi:hypothetical protein
MADTRGISVGPGWLLRHADTLLASLENTQVRVNGIASGLTGAVVEEVVWKAPVDATITAMRFMPSAASTIGTCTIINKGTAGSGTVAIATINAASVAAFSEQTLSLSTVTANLEVDQGEYVTFKRGTASATTCPVAGLVEIAWYMRRTKRDGS